MAPLTNTSDVWRHGWHAVATAEEVAEAQPLQVWVAGQPWVLTRLAGEATAFVDRCPHRLAPLSAGRVVPGPDGAPRLACGYHGWQFRADGRCDLIPSLGKSENISKRAALTAPAGVAEAYGLVWLAPDTPLVGLPAFPEWDDGAADRARSVIVRTTASAGQLVDNFLDAAHFPYVHAGTFGVDDGAPLGIDAVTTDGWTVTSSFVAPYLDTVAEGGAGPAEHTVSKTAGPASSVHLRLDLPGATVGILLACLPETATSTRVFKLLTRDDLHGDAGRIEQFVKEEDLILNEDLTILERYGDAGLPLDTRAELHTRSDRLSLAWRRVMAAAAAQVGEQAVTPW